MKNRAWLWAVVAVGLLFTVAEASWADKLDRCIARCERNHPTPVPTASPTPAPTLAPLPCEPIGGAQTFTTGQPRMFCFTAIPGSTFVTIEATSPGNVGCAYFALELTEPNGRKTHTDGASYPITTSSSPRVVGGRYYFWVSPQWISDGAGCGTYTLTVR